MSDSLRAMQELNPIYHRAQRQCERHSLVLGKDCACEPCSLFSLLAAAERRAAELEVERDAAQAVIVTWATWLRATFPKELEVQDEEQALLDYAAALARRVGLRGAS